MFFTENNPTLDQNIKRYSDYDEEKAKARWIMEKIVHDLKLFYSIKSSIMVQERI